MTFVEQILEKLTPHGPIRARAMFGGHGIYYGDVMFACIAEGQLYFRVGENNRKDFEQYHSKPFIYEGQRKPIQMPYMTLPTEVFHQAAQLKKWIEKAREAAFLSKKKK